MLRVRLRELKALDKLNLIRLALVSLLVTCVDTVQSFYLQRSVNVFSEVNALPKLFYNTGALGYLLYIPVEFVAVFVTLTMCWIWASYVIWYHKNVVAKTRVL